MMVFCCVNHCGACKYMGCDNHINSLVMDDFVKDVKVIGGIEGIV